MGLSEKMLAELADSRFRGEPDLHFFARFCRQKIGRWIDANDDVQTGQIHKSNSEVMRKLEAEERHARFFLTGAVDLLKESLSESKAPNGAEE